VAPQAPSGASSKRDTACNGLAAGPASADSERHPERPEAAPLPLGNAESLMSIVAGVNLTVPKTFRMAARETLASMRASRFKAVVS
jgi:hypothetical protein